MSRVLDLWAGMTGTVLDFAGSTAPDGWLLCFGQSLLRADYPNLFAKIGTTYGAADGTHFNVPDCRGRVGAGKDDMGGTAAGLLNVTLTGTRASTATGVITGLSSTAGLSIGMSAAGTGVGAGAVISSIDSATQVTLSVNSASTGSGSIRFGVVDGATLGASGGAHIHTLTTPQSPAHTHTFPQTTNTNRSTSSGGSEAILTTLGLNTTVTSTGDGQAHPNMQPTIVLNKIIKT